MSVALNTTSVLPYIGNGLAKTFPITFPTFEAETIGAKISQADGVSVTLVPDVDFTLASVGIPNTNASMTLVNGGQPWLTAGGNLKTGYTIYVMFLATGYQPMKGRDWGAFAPERIEKTLDRFGMAILSVKAIASQALGIQIGDGTIPPLPPLAGNALKILQVNAAANGFEYGVTSTEIFQAKDDAITAKNDAVTAKNQSEGFAEDAEAYKNAAATSENNALSHANSASNSKDTAVTAANGAAASQAAAAQSVTDANTAKNGAVAAQTAAEIARDEALAAAADTSLVEQYKIETEGFRDEAEAFRDQTLTYRNDTAGFRDEAINAANDAETAMTGAESALALASIEADEAAESAEQAELFANIQTYSKKKNISFADSPYTVDEDDDMDSIFIVDDAGGDVIINLPTIASTDDHPAWKVGFMKKAATGNSLIVNRAGTDTISGNTSVTVEDPGLGVLIYANSPTDWASKFFVSVIAADGFVLSGSALNFGDPGVDGTWRIRQDGTDLKYEQRQLGVWVEADIMNPPTP